MYRGITTFVCHDCGNRFKGPGMEWAATVLNYPLTCPRCGGQHTRLKALFKLNLPQYYLIWKAMDKQKMNDKE